MRSWEDCKRTRWSKGSKDRARRRWEVCSVTRQSAAVLAPHGSGTWCFDAGSAARWMNTLEVEKSSGMSSHWRRRRRSSSGKSFRDSLGWEASLLGRGVTVSDMTGLRSVLCAIYQHDIDTNRTDSLRSAHGTRQPSISGSRYAA